MHFRLRSQVLLGTSHAMLPLVSSSMTYMVSSELEQKAGSDENYILPRKPYAVGHFHKLSDISLRTDMVAYSELS